MVQKVINNPIPVLHKTVAFLYMVHGFAEEKNNTKSTIRTDIYPNAYIKWVKNKDVYRDGVINDFLSWCIYRYFLVLFLFHDLHPPEMIFPLVPLIFYFREKAPTKRSAAPRREQSSCIAS